jgi:hypothetical protein
LAPMQRRARAAPSSASMRECSTCGLTSGGRKQDERVCVVERASDGARAERAVRHAEKFRNEPVAPLTAVRQDKPLWLLQM